jgi:phage tail protein X
MSDDLEKQIPAEEKLYSAEVSKLLTAAVNSRTARAAADELNSTSGKWPYPPTPELVALLQKQMMTEWGKQKSKYKAFNETLTLEVKKGKTPEVKAELKYDGDWCGGKSVMLKPGDTVTSLAEKEYGYAAYAAAIWEANEDVLGSKCKVLPAGFGLELPKIWVPNWVKEPKTRIPMVAKAQEVQKIPTIEVDFSTKGETTTRVIVGNIIVEITFTITGEVKISNTGTVDATFNPKAQSAAITKALGPITGDFTLDFKSKKGDAGAALTLFNKEVSGLKFTGSLKFGSGGFSINMGVSTVKIIDGDLTITGSFKAKADIKIYPNPKPVEVEAEAASVGVLIALGLILAPIAAEVAAGVEIESFGAGAAKLLKEFVKVAPQAIKAM